MAARLFVWFTIGNGQILILQNFLSLFRILLYWCSCTRMLMRQSCLDIAAPHKDRNKSNRIESNLLCLRPCRLCLLHASPAYLCCPRRTILHPKSTGPPIQQEHRQCKCLHNATIVPRGTTQRTVVLVIRVCNTKVHQLSQNRRVLHR